MQLSLGVSGLRNSTLPAALAPGALRAARFTGITCHADCSRKISKRTPDPARNEGTSRFFAAPVAAAVLAGMLLSSAVTPDEALAARSSGRMGGSSFRSSAPAPSGGGGGSSYRGGNTYNSYTVAPSIGGYGGGYYPGGFGGGITLFPSFYSPPVFGLALPLGVMFNLMFTLFVIGAAFTLIKNVIGSFIGGGRNKKEDWD